MFFRKVSWKIHSLLVQIRFSFSPNVDIKKLTYIPFSSYICVSKKSNLSIESIKISENCKIVGRDDAKIKIGNNVYLNSGCQIVAHKSIIIGDSVQMGQNVMVLDHDHLFIAGDGIQNDKFKCDEIIIEDNVWIGANTIILKGVHVGRNSIIGAGSVVTKNIDAGSVFIQKRQSI